MASDSECEEEYVTTECLQELLISMNSKLKHEISSEMKAMIECLKKDNSELVKQMNEYRQKAELSEKEIQECQKEINALKQINENKLKSIIRNEIEDFINQSTMTINLINPEAISGCNIISLNEQGLQDEDIQCQAILAQSLTPDISPLTMSTPSHTTETTTLEPAKKKSKLRISRRFDWKLNKAGSDLIATMCKQRGYSRCQEVKDGIWEEGIKRRLWEDSTAWHLRILTKINNVCKTADT